MLLAIIMQETHILFAYGQHQGGAKHQSAVVLWFRDARVSVLRHLIPLEIHRVHIHRRSPFAAVTTTHAPGRQEDTWACANSFVYAIQVWFAHDSADPTECVVSLSTA